MLLASLVTGELWKHFGPGAPFYVSTALAVIAALMLLMQKALSTQQSAFSQRNDV